MNDKFDASKQPIKLYRSAKSGHCHRAELMLSLLELPYENIDVDMAAGANKKEPYLTLNPLGQIPTIDDNGFILSDSNAILIYLSQKYHNGYDWYPKEINNAAIVQRFLSIAAGEIASGPCAARLVTVFGIKLDHKGALEKTKTVCDFLESTLESQPFLAGEHITLADIACYSYIAHAPEGGFDLSPYPAILAWLAKIESQKGFIPMIRSALPA